jgi:hypothetical protein
MQGKGSCKVSANGMGRPTWVLDEHEMPGAICQNHLDKGKSKMLTSEGQRTPPGQDKKIQGEWTFMTWTYLLQLSLLASHLVSAHDSGQDNAHGEDGCQPCITDVPHVLEGILSRLKGQFSCMGTDNDGLGTEERLWIIAKRSPFGGIKQISVSEEEGGEEENGVWGRDCLGRMHCIAR